MCINYKAKAADRNKWLKKQPEVITAYKIVRIKPNRNIKANNSNVNALFPLYYNNPKNQPFKRVNRLQTIKDKKNSHKTEGTAWESNYGRSTSYVAYYHFYETFADASRHQSWQRQEMVIKCHIPKKLVTDIGNQCGRVIVAKGFDIVDADAYLE